MRTISRRLFHGDKYVVNIAEIDHRFLAGTEELYYRYNQRKLLSEAGNKTINVDSTQLQASLYYLCHYPKFHIMISVKTKTSSEERKYASGFLCNIEGFIVTSADI